MNRNHALSGLSSRINLLNSLFCQYTKPNVIKTEKKLATGTASHIPVSPKNNGSIRTAGTRRSS